ADVLSSNYNSPAAPAALGGGGAFGSGGVGAAAGRSASRGGGGGDEPSGGSGQLNLSSRGSDGDVGASFVQSIDSIRLAEQSRSPENFAVPALGGVGGVVSTNPLRNLRPVRGGAEQQGRRSSDNSSSSVASTGGVDQRQWASSSGRQRGTGGSDGGSSVASSASNSASGVGVGVAPAGYRTAGGSRSSLNILRRKKIARSASLEDTEDDRYRSAELGGVRGMSGFVHDGVLGGIGGGGLGGAGIVRGRGRDGALAHGAGYVRSQSVSDEVVPMDNSSFDNSGEFDPTGDVTANDGHLHLHHHHRRKGLVSRMRRTASNVIRHPFRNTVATSRSGSGGSGGQLGVQGQNALY
ncbi:unnamed protein product, partial [Scytosiphon promiscuus]